MSITSSTGTAGDARRTQTADRKGGRPPAQPHSLLWVKHSLDPHISKVQPWVLLQVQEFIPNGYREKGITVELKLLSL